MNKYIIVNEYNKHLHVSRVGENWTTVYKWSKTPRYRNEEDAERIFREYKRDSDSVSCKLMKIESTNE